MYLVHSEGTWGTWYSEDSAGYLTPGTFPRYQVQVRMSKFTLDKLKGELSMADVMIWSLAFSLSLTIP